MSLFMITGRYWVSIFISIIVLGIFFHSITLSYSPISWTDEVHINEIARGGVWDKSSDWNMALIRTDGQIDKQSWALYYIGGVFSEIGYSFGGQGGNRVVNLFALMLSTLFVYFYFFRKTGDKYFSSLIGLLYFAFPPLVQSVRGGRVDIFAFMFFFAALCLLQESKKDGNKFLLMCVCASGLVLISILSWITAVLCVPIVLWEVLAKFDKYDTHIKRRIYILLLMLFSGGITFVVLQIPMFIKFQSALEMFRFILSLNSSVSDEAPYFKSFFKTMIVLPGVYVFGLPVLFIRKKTALLAISVFIVCFVAIMTHCYVFRMLYLLPYALIGLSEIYIGMKEQRNRLRFLFALVGFVILSGLYSVVLRNGTEYFMRNIRDFNTLKQVLKAEVGTNCRIYCDSFQLYYIGRELQWKQYKLVKDNLSRMEEFFENYEVDYYITEKKDIPMEVRELLNDNGFSFKKKVTPFKLDKISKVEGLLRRLKRLNTYGPYYLYSKNE